MSRSIVIAGETVALAGLIERGGMADVYEAQLANGEQLAVKVLRKELAMQREFVDMFFDESKISSRLVHPNIVRTLGTSTLEGTPALVMERLRGPSVRELIHRHRGAAAKPSIAMTIGWQTASALDCAHTLAGDDGRPLEIVHRDVSPSNIIVDESGAAKLIDFGIAVAIERLAERTRTGLLKGKDGYMSPEQCLGSKIDRRSDIFSLGIVLYELCTGQPLFRRDVIENSFTVMERVTAARIPEAPMEVAGLDAATKSIVLRCLEHESEDRYSTAGELAEAIAKASPNAALAHSAELSAVASDR